MLGGHLRSKILWFSFVYGTIVATRQARKASSILDNEHPALGPPTVIWYGEGTWDGRRIKPECSRYVNYLCRNSRLSSYCCGSRYESIPPSEYSMEITASPMPTRGCRRVDRTSCFNKLSSLTDQDSGDILHTTMLDRTGAGSRSGEERTR